MTRQGTPVNFEQWLTNDKTHGRITWQTGNHMTDMEQDMNKPKCDRDKTKTCHQESFLINVLLDFFFFFRIVWYYRNFNRATFIWIINILTECLLSLLIIFNASLLNKTTVFISFREILLIPNLSFFKCFERSSDHILWLDSVHLQTNAFLNFKAFWYAEPFFIWHFIGLFEITFSDKFCTIRPSLL